MYGQAKPDEDSALKRMLGMLDLISPTVIGQLALSRFDYKPLFGIMNPRSSPFIFGKDWTDLTRKSGGKRAYDYFESIVVS